MIAAAIAALEVFEQDKDKLLFELSRKTELFRTQLRSLGLDVGDSPTPIVPIKVGRSVTAAKAARYCHDHAVFIHPVFPPVVKKGHSLLRASIAANHSDEDLISAAKTISSAVFQAKEQTTEEELLMG
jgi:7-keto-8-aminopelargonate synthetase-like enzyme